MMGDHNGVMKPQDKGHEVALFVVAEGLGYCHC